MIAQSIGNALIAASPVVLVASGLSLIYSCTRTLHFAHGAVLACAPYTVYLLHRGLELPVAPSLVVGGLAAGGLAVVLDLLIYAPLRRSSASPLAILLASLGVAVILQNGLSLAFGDNVQSWRGPASSSVLHFLGVRMTISQVVGVFVAAGLSVSVLAGIAMTRMGRLYRAVSSESGLAEAVGVESRKVIRLAYGLGGLLAGVAGLILAADTDMAPGMGAPFLMLGLVAFVIGGTRNVGGALVGTAVLMGLRQMVGVWIGTRWMDGVVFSVFLAVLLARPDGVIGRVKERDA